MNKQINKRNGIATKPKIMKIPWEQAGKFEYRLIIR